MILVFAGAGASKAVRPERYPTTVEFFERLPEAVTNDQLFAQAANYLTAVHGGGPLDIEQVLWLTADLRDFTSRAADAESVIGWFIQGNRLATVGGRQEDVRPLITVARAATTAIDTLSSRINTLVYDLYGEPPSKEDLDANWRPLLSALMATNDQLELVTTNYDIVLEEAISLVKAPVLTGRTTANQPTLDASIWDIRGMSVESFSSFGRLTKLHGSVDWVRGKDKIFVGTPLFQGRHERHAIIYPGFKGTPTDPLFQQLHRYFQERLSQADVAIFIGYAFRDQYVNDLLERNLRRSAQVFILNPAERLPTMPFPESRTQHVRSGFDREGVRALLELVVRASTRGESDATIPR